MITEKEFEDILCKYPELIEPDLRLKDRQAHIYGRRMDIVFEDKFNRTLIIELKRGPIKDEHIGQILSYEGILLSSENPTIRVMLIGNRVPPNIRNSLDHHGIAWKEITISYLIEFLTAKNDLETLKLFERKDSVEERNNQLTETSWNSDLIHSVPIRGDDPALIKSKHQIKWEKQFNILVQYRKENPSFWPKQWEEYPKGNLLGIWCLNQRNAYKQGRLPKERYDLLSGISFTFVISPHQDAWDRQFEYLKQFRVEFPDRWPFSNEEYPQGNKLGAWLWKQRRLYNKKKMLPDNYEKLNQLGFSFENLDYRSFGFEKPKSHAEHAHSQLEEFLREHVQICVEDGVYIEKGELYERYCQWAKKRGHYPVHPPRFSQYVYLKYSSVTPKNARMVYDDKPEKRIWRNLKFVAQETDQPQTNSPGGSVFAKSDVDLFFEEHIEVCMGEYITKMDLYEKYKQWCGINKIYALSRGRFGSAVYIRYHHETPKDTKIQGGGPRIWRNIVYVEAKI